MKLRAVLCVLLLCSLTAPATRAAGVITNGSLPWGGLDRSYRLYQPSGYRKGQPLALVVALHGGFGTGEIFAAQSGFDAVAESSGFLVVYPDGEQRAWNAGTCCGPPMDKKLDDVGFIRALVAQLRARYSVDPARIYGTGFSNGAMLLHRIACEAPEVFVAIAPVSGGLMTGGCASTQKISALLIQGRLDERIPWDGGVFNETRRPSIKELVAGLASRDACSAAEKSTEKGEGFECFTRQGCQAGTEVSWCGLDQVGHQWAGGKTYFPRVLGPNSDRFQTSQRVWEFFSRHRGPERTVGSAR